MVFGVQKCSFLSCKKTEQLRGNGMDMSKDHNPSQPRTSNGSRLAVAWNRQKYLAPRPFNASIHPEPGHEDAATLVSPKKKLKPRGQWASKYEFILSHMGFCVGLGNVWRFPYVCYKNGGGAFFIPYLVCLITAGVPIVFLEIALGQYYATGGISCWDISPVFRGIGYGTSVIVFLLNSYYAVVLAWGALYLVNCIIYATSDLPWTTCDNPWNTVYCSNNVSTISDATQPHDNASPSSDPATEFWERKILRISSGIEEVGDISWELALSLFVVSVVNYLCVCKGIKTSGKVVYFTALFPYVMLVILISRGLSLPGAVDGLRYYLTPNMTKLTEPGVWVDAGTQVFFSYAVALGSLTALGSCNSFSYDCYKHSLALCFCDTLTSFFAGFAVFTVLGFMAHESGPGITVDNVAESGPGLAFIVYPKAAAQMPLGALWAALFFVMLLLLGLDSQFGATEGLVTAIVDVYPRVFLKGYRKEILVGCICVIWYLIGLSMITQGGMYVLQLFDYFSASGFSLLWIAFWECVVVGWFYGADRMYDNVALMVGYRMNPWMRWGWKYAGPLFTTCIFLFSIVKYEPLVYNRTYVYPGWAQAFGWCLALSSMLCVPGYLLYRLLSAKGSLHQRWEPLTSSTAQERPEALLEQHRKVQNAFLGANVVGSTLQIASQYAAAESSTEDHQRSTS